MTAPRLAWGLFATYAVIALATLALVVARGDLEDLFFIAVIGYALVGAMVASRLPGNAVGWLLLGIALSLSFTALVDTNLRSEDAWLVTVSSWLSAWVWYVWLTFAGILLPLLFPTGRLPSRRWRPVLWLGIAALTLSAGGQAFMPGVIDADAPIRAQNPLGFGGEVAAVMARAGDVLAAAGFLLAAASLVVRFRHSLGVEREQLKWFAAAGLIALTGLALAMLQVLFGARTRAEEAGVLEAIGTVGWFTALGAIVVAIPIATGMAILRHRLYDIDVVINRTLVYGALTATLAAAYLGSVLLLGLTVGESDVAIAVSTLAVAALFRPARARIQALVDRRFYRRRYDAARTLESFGARLRDEVDIDAVGAELRTAVRDSVQPAHLTLWLQSDRRTT